MLSLQREQFKHDERFHREVFNLTIHARLNHMALHFCKYTGQLAEVYLSRDAHLRAKTITDSFIISLCAANALNFDLSQAVTPNLGNSATVHEIAIHLTNQAKDNSCLDDLWLLTTHANYAAKMARACEKIDHLEKFEFREEMQLAILNLCRTTLIGSVINDLDMVFLVQRRHCEIRELNPFKMNLDFR